MENTIFELSVKIQNEGQVFSKLKKESNSAFSQIQKDASQTGNMMSSMLGAAGVVGGVAMFGELVKSSFQLGAQLEQDKVAMSTLVGSVGEGNKLFAELKNMGNKSPYETADLITASKTMLSFGINAKDVLPALSAIGDIGMGSADKMKSLSLVYSQIMTNGKMMTQDFYQLINQGFNPLTIISEKTGRSMADLRKDMEKGAISASMVQDAFTAATSVGGLFYDMMNKQSVTVSGRFSTLKDTFDTFRATLVESSSGAIAGFIASITTLVERFTRNIDAIKKYITIFLQLAKYFIIYKTTMFLLNKGMLAYELITKGVRIAQILLTGAIRGSTMAMTTFKSAMISTGIGGLVILLTTLISKIVAARNAAKAPEKTEAQKEIEEQLKTIADIENRYKNINQLTADQKQTLSEAVNEQLKAAEIAQTDAVLRIKNSDEYKKLIALQKELNEAQASGNRGKTATLPYEINELKKYLETDLPKSIYGISGEQIVNNVNRLKQIQAGIGTLGINKDALEVKPSKALNDLSNEMTTQHNIKNLTINIGVVKGADTINIENVAGEKYQNIESAVNLAILKGTASYVEAGV